MGLLSQSQDALGALQGVGKDGAWLWPGRRLRGGGRLQFGRGIDLRDQGAHGFLIYSVELGEATTVHFGHDLDQRPIKHLLGAEGGRTGNLGAVLGLNDIGHGPGSGGQARFDRHLGGDG